MLFETRPELTAADVVHRMGHVFAVFDHCSQDSSNVSYGVVAGHTRYFVKTAGTAQVARSGRSRADRVELLRRATQVHLDVDHPALGVMHKIVTTSDGIAIVHDWFDGELLGCPHERRDDPAEAHYRFKYLPAKEIAHALDQVIDLHVALENAGWITGDLYDGCLMYDFSSGDVRVVDFEFYRKGSYRNDEGRLPGSTRFMAPEEFQRGATIDSRTTVFNLARAVEIFLLAKNEIPRVRDIVDQATADRTDDRPATVARFQTLWRAST